MNNVALTPYVLVKEIYILPMIKMHGDKADTPERNMLLLEKVVGGLYLFLMI